MNDPSVWRVATVEQITDETPTVKTFRFRFDSPIEHLAGQHYEIRLTAEDGYQVARLYSAASIGTGDKYLELTIALLPNGELSTYMHEQVRPGDQVEIRGPLGKFFIWQPEATNPVLLIGGGSGVVPLRCILAAHKRASVSVPMRLVYSARTFDEIIYKLELLNVPEVTITLTGSAPATWQGKSGRIGAELMQDALRQLPADPVLYVCGATPFVEAMADLAVTLGVPPAQIKAERFGATQSGR